PDIALIKYWGKKDETLRLPENGSISLILAGLETVTTVEFRDELTEDQIEIQGESEEGEVRRVRDQLERVRQMGRKQVYAIVVSKNTFPKGTGLSSSGSGFAALTIAATKAIGLNLNEKEMSILARQGSGTACRCVCGGIVEWKDGETSDASYSETIYPAEYWDIRDVVVVVDEGKKLLSSTKGHTLAKSSPFYGERLKRIEGKIEEMKMVIKNMDFKNLGELVEAEALEFHSILLTSQPSMIAWYPGTVEVMLAVQALRNTGIPAYFTINTGFNVHVLTLPEHEKRVKEELGKLSLVKKIISTKIGEKPSELNDHLF
ncbi:MAG: diphosphomevalonate decarboxylase, partial [bacterium]